MVEKFKKILSDIEQEKGEVILFAIIKTDDLSDKWSVIFCATWATTENRSDTFKFIQDIFIKNLTVEENESIARIGIYDKGEYIVKSLLAFNSGFEIKEETRINGFTTRTGFIIKSNPPTTNP